MATLVQAVRLALHYGETHLGVTNFSAPLIGPFNAENILLTLATLLSRGFLSGENGRVDRVRLALDVVQHAREKLHNKKLDAVVANDITRTDAGFDADRNAVTIITRDGGDGLELPLMSKLAAAHRILDEIIRLRGQKRETVVAGSVST